MISIHASEKEATRLHSQFLRLGRYFNPRLREGGDRGAGRILYSLPISIHASEKEATSTLHTGQLGSSNFNPRLREGGDKIIRKDLGKDKFQSTPPRRRRPSSVKPNDMLFRFQSTPPRRRRQQHIVIPQLSCTYLVSTTFLSTIFSFISQYVVLFFLF